ncbi:gamma carbonic anhydrase family protein [Allonocardiopsis opalescens]|nr:gamma carbonic anhydrase family protein [Allonocardiopsis opalescens]
MSDYAERYPGAWIGSADFGGPEIHPEAWVAPTAVVVGRVILGPGSTVWYGSVLRAEAEDIEVGAEVNIQDGCVLHVDPGEPTLLEDRVSLGHQAMVHGAHIGTGALIGIGAAVLHRATVGAGALVAAGAVVPPGTAVPAGVLYAGVPGRVIRELTDDDIARQARTPDNYVRRGAEHAGVRWAG